MTSCVVEPWHHIDWLTDWCQYECKFLSLFFKINVYFSGFMMTDENHSHHRNVTWCILDNLIFLKHSLYALETLFFLLFDLYWPLSKTVLSYWSTELLHLSLPVRWCQLINMETIEVNHTVRQQFNRTV